MSDFLSPRLPRRTPVPHAGTVSTRRDLPWSFISSLLVHATLIAFAVEVYRTTWVAPRTNAAMNLHFLLVAPEEKEAAAPNPQPAVPEPAPVPPELPLPPVAASPPPEAIKPPEPPAIVPITTTNPYARSSGMAVPRRPHRPAANAPTSATASGTAGGATDSHPRYAVNPPPDYPTDERRLHHEGVVLLHVKVTAEGAATDVRLQHTSGFPALDAAALAAVRRWKFEPARANGIAVAAEVEVPVRFQIK
jgi:protein TonB